jgi:hypothetical protein
MIAAIVLNIVLHAQMTIPWIGGSKATAAPVAQSTLVLVLTPADGVVVLDPAQLIVLQ